MQTWFTSSPWSLTGPPGGSSNITVTEHDYNCNGYWEVPRDGSYFDWISSNPSVASVDTGFVSCLAPGSSTVTASYRDPLTDYFDQSGPDDCYCVTSPANTDTGAQVTVEPTATIGSLVAVGKNQTADVQVTIQPASNTTGVTLTLSTTSGTGTAQFSDGTTSRVITQTTTVTIRGVTESSTANNIRLKASVNDNQLASSDFTVLLVILTLRNTGVVSSDNQGGPTYSATLGTSGLGTFFNAGGNSANHIWRTGVEIVGTVTPNSFGSLIVLDREVALSKLYADTSNGSTLFQTVNPMPDTSQSNIRDDDPQSGGSNGKVYDLDAPGQGTGGSQQGTIERRRTNFRQWATVNGVRVSGDFFWFSRISIIKGANGDQLNSDIAGDNISGLGCTSLSWNLQGPC